MQFKYLLSIIFLSSTLFANNYHSTLIIPSVDLHNPFWEYSNNRIDQKEDYAFIHVVEKWNGELFELWKKIKRKIKLEINASIEQIDFYLADQRFIDAYLNYYQQILPDITNGKEQEDIDPLISNFVRLKLNYLQFNHPIKFYWCDNINCISFSFGTNQTGHYLLLHKKLYNQELLHNLYDASKKDEPLFHIEPYNERYPSRVIEYCNLFHFCIAQAISNIIHQSDYFAKMLQIFIFNQKQLEPETYNYGNDYITFRSYLEACLQSKNPVEAAIFIQPQIDNLHHDFTLLWDVFITDLENCYDEQDLADYQSLSLSIRRAALYTNQENEES